MNTSAQSSYTKLPSMAAQLPFTVLVIIFICQTALSWPKPLLSNCHPIPTVVLCCTSLLLNVCKCAMIELSCDHLSYIPPLSSGLSLCLRLFTCILISNSSTAYVVWLLHLFECFPFPGDLPTTSFNAVCYQNYF